MRLGTKVRIHKPTGDGESRLGWTSGMDKYDGKEGIVIRKTLRYAKYEYEVSRFVGACGKPFFFIEEWMEVVND